MADDPTLEPSKKRRRRRPPPVSTLDCLPASLRACLLGFLKARDLAVVTGTCKDYRTGGRLVPALFRYTASTGRVRWRDAERFAVAFPWFSSVRVEKSPGGGAVSVAAPTAAAPTGGLASRLAALVSSAFRRDTMAAEGGLSTWLRSLLPTSWGASEPGPLPATRNPLTGLCAFRALDLKGNSLGGDEATALAETLKVNATVHTLDLGYNRIGDAGATAVAEALKVNATVHTLWTTE